MSRFVGSGFSSKSLGVCAALRLCFALRFCGSRTRTRQARITGLGFRVYRVSGFGFRVSRRLRRVGASLFLRFFALGTRGGGLLEACGLIGLASVKGLGRAFGSESEASGSADAWWGSGGACFDALLYICIE